MVQCAGKPEPTAELGSFARLVRLSPRKSKILPPHLVHLTRLFRLARLVFLVHLVRV